MPNNKRTAKHPTDILSKGGPPPLLIPHPKPKLPLASISAPNSISDPFLALCTARRSTYLTYLTYRCSIQLAHPFFVLLVEQWDGKEELCGYCGSYAHITISFPVLFVVSWTDRKGSYIISCILRSWSAQEVCASRLDRIAAAILT